MRREAINPEVVKAVEESAYHRIHAKSDKELMQEFPVLSRASIFRIMRAARQRLRLEDDRMKQLSQSNSDSRRQNLEDEAHLRADSAVRS